MKIGICGPSYTAQSNIVGDEECINLFYESVESKMQAAMGTTSALYGTPGTKIFSALSETPVRGCFRANDRAFAVAGNQLLELSSDGTATNRGTVANDGKPVSIAFNQIQLLIVSGNQAYCFTLGTNVLVEVTGQLAGTPIQCDCSDTYFIVIFKDSNKYQMSEVLDGTTWPGQLVNEVSVFPDNLVSMLVNHRELWLFGNKRAQPFQDTGSASVFDAIPGALIETGSAATFSVCRLDNSVFWIGQDERGAAIARRSDGYTPKRISTYAVEVWLSQQERLEELVSYAYQERGHLFWVLYVPGGDCSWVYDVGENLWHKRAFWTDSGYEPHHSWNYIYAFGKHLVGDWQSGNLYEMSFDFLDDAGSRIRRLRRSPTVTDEMKWIRMAELTLDLAPGLTPQPPFQGGNYEDRPAQVMLRWSDDRGKTWKLELIASCGFSGEFNTRVNFRRLGRTRYRVWEVSMTDPIPWCLIGAYLRTA